MYHQW